MRAAKRCVKPWGTSLVRLVCRLSRLGTPRATVFWLDAVRCPPLDADGGLIERFVARDPDTRRPRARADRGHVVPRAGAVHARARERRWRTVARPCRPRAFGGDGRDRRA